MGIARSSRQAPPGATEPILVATNVSLWQLLSFLLIAQLSSNKPPVIARPEGRQGEELEVTDSHGWVDKERKGGGWGNEEGLYPACGARQADMKQRTAEEGMPQAAPAGKKA